MRKKTVHFSRQAIDTACEDGSNVDATFARAVGAYLRALFENDSEVIWNKMEVIEQLRMLDPPAFRLSLMDLLSMVLDCDSASLSELKANRGAPLPDADDVASRMNELTDRVTKVIEIFTVC